MRHSLGIWVCLAGLCLVGACETAVPIRTDGLQAEPTLDANGSVEAAALADGADVLDGPTVEGGDHRSDAGAIPDSVTAADTAVKPDAGTLSKCGNKVCDAGEDCLSCLTDCACGTGKTYYVSTTGKDTNAGTSLSSPWRTIAKAANVAAAGDTVFVKAGNYGHEHVVFKNSGTSKNPIVLIGYRSTPGDSPRPTTKPGEKLDPTVMPLIHGADVTGIGVHVNAKSYIWLKNFQITYYEYGLHVVSSNHIRVDNLFAYEFGRVSWGSGLGSDFSGLAVFFKLSDYCELRDSVITDGKAENILFQSCNYNLIENCESHGVRGDSVANATDYYIVLYNSHDNVVRNCLAQNHHTTIKNSHYGHGIGVKHGYRNKFINCTARGFAKCFHVSDNERKSTESETYDNEFIGCTAYDDGLSQVTSSNGFLARDGAHHNTFRDCRAMPGVSIGIRFWNSEGHGGGHDNTFTNLVLNGVKTAVQLEAANNNVFRNLVISKASTVVTFTNGTSSGNKMSNSVLTGSSRFASGTGSLPTTYSDFFSNSFAMPSGTGNFAADPLFANATAADFHLKSQAGRWNGQSWVKDPVTSPCIDKGDPASAHGQETAPNGGRINLGAYGNTAEASRSP